MNNEYFDVLIPGILSLTITYLYFRPILKQLDYPKKAAYVLLWIILPNSMWMPVAFAQPYFRDSSYTIVTIDKPTDIYKYPNERFFKIESFKVVPEFYSVVNEQHSTERHGTTLVVSNYYIAPIYDDTTEIFNGKLSTIGYGVVFTTSMNNGFFFKDDQPEQIKSFIEKSMIDYQNFNFYDVDYFEKFEYDDCAEYFRTAIKQNDNFEQNLNELVLIKQMGTIQDLYSKDRNLFLYSLAISLSICLITIFLINDYSNSPPSS